jgi:hypothetical protein
MNPLPPANPQYVETKPGWSKDGQTFRMDIMALHRLFEHDRIFKVKPVEVRS